MENAITQDQMELIQRLLEEKGYANDTEHMVKVYTGGATKDLHLMNKFQASKLIRFLTTGL